MHKHDSSFIIVCFWTNTGIHYIYISYLTCGYCVNHKNDRPNVARCRHSTDKSAAVLVLGRTAPVQNEKRLHTVVCMSILLGYIMRRPMLAAFSPGLLTTSYESRFHRGHRLTVSDFITIYNMRLRLSFNISVMFVNCLILDYWLRFIWQLMCGHCFTVCYVCFDL